MLERGKGRDVGDDALGDLQDFLPWIGEADNPVAGSAEDLEPEFRLEQLDLPADARLRGVERLGVRRQMVAVARDL